VSPLYQPLLASAFSGAKLVIKQKARAPQLQLELRGGRSELIFQTQIRNGSACLPCFEELSVGIPHSLWKTACEGSQVFKVHQDSFLNTAIRVTGQRESDF